MSKSKNDIAWEKIFEKYCILDKLANERGYEMNYKQ